VTIISLGNGVISSLDKNRIAGPAILRDIRLLDLLSGGPAHHGLVSRIPHILFMSAAVQEVDAHLLVHIVVGNGFIAVRHAIGGGRDGLALDV
jgi:hypothetical protein